MNFQCVDSAHGCNTNSLIKSILRPPPPLSLPSSISPFSFLPALFNSRVPGKFCWSICPYSLYSYYPSPTHPPPWRLVKTVTRSQIHLNLRIEMPLAHGLTNPSPSRERLVRTIKSKAARKNVIKHGDCHQALPPELFQPPTSVVTPKKDAI